MRHNYVKSLLLIMVALMGFTTHTSANVKLQFKDSDGNPLSSSAFAGQKIEAKWSIEEGYVDQEEYKEIQLNNDGSFIIEGSNNQSDSEYWVCVRLYGEIVLDFDRYFSAPNQDATIEVNLCKLRFNCNKDGEVARASYRFTTVSIECNKDYYLPKGTTWCYSSKTWNSYDLNQNTVKNVYTITFKVVEPDGTPLEGVEISTSSGYVTTDANGTAQINVEEGDLEVYSGGTVEGQIYNDITSDQTFTFIIPKMMSFKVIEYGKVYEEEYIYVSLRGRSSVKCDRYPDGFYKGRIDPEGFCRLLGTDNYIQITDGMTIRVGTFCTRTDGVGLDFYSYSNDGFISGRDGADVIIGGTPLLITAVPAGNEKFICWEINGKEYTSPMIDFVPKDDVTIATAKFTGEISTDVHSIAKQSAETINVRLENNYLILPSDVDAEASIYAMDGHLTKRTGVVGDRIFVGNLPDGAYVLMLSVNGHRQTATFVQK